MKQILLLCSLFFVNVLQAQTELSKEQLSPCGALPYDKPFRQSLQNVVTTRGADSIFYIPITMHVLGDDAGKNYFQAYKIYDALCQLNKDYVASNLQFYFKGEILYHNDTKNYSHATIRDGAKMMFKYNVDSTLNCYVVGSPAGNCGYNLPYAGIALSKNCMGATDHTWAHEVGHGLSLQHPFYGWEAKKYDPNKATPARQTMTEYTYFKETYFPKDTIIYDTVNVETVNAVGCAKAADGFCDTKPDYISVRWSCDAQGFSPGTYKDPNGESFKVDGSLIMSYSLDACQTRFSTEEIAQMRKMLLLKRPQWAGKSLNGKVVNGTATLVAPLNGVLLAADNIMLNWQKVPDAKGYIVQVSRLETFGVLDVDTLISANTFMTKKLLNDRNYFWRVRPYGNYGGCASFSSTGKFKTTASVAVNELQNEVFINVYPTLLDDNDVLHIQLLSKSVQDLKCSIYDINGRTVIPAQTFSMNGEQQLEIPMESLAKGMYFVEISNGKARFIQKIVK